MSRNHRNRNSKGGSDQSSGRGWEITFCSFILILLAFFIMLSSFATMEKSRITLFVRSFSQALNILSGGLKFDSNKDIISMETPDIMKNNEILPALKRIVKAYNLEEEIGLSITGRGLVMTLVDTVLFDLGKADISPEAFPLLNKMGSIISKCSFPIRIEGHTDNLPIHTEKFPSNWELSTARAVNVLRYFIENEKISPERLSALGYGEFQPLYPNSASELRPRNRRVEIVFIGTEQDFLSEIQINE